MKFVAKRDILNVPAIGITLKKDVPGFVHEKHIHKGHRFSIGTSDDFNAFTREEQETITALISSEAVVVENDKNRSAIEKIDAEAKIDRARAERESRARAGEK